MKSVLCKRQLCLEQLKVEEEEDGFQQRLHEYNQKVWKKPEDPNGRLDIIHMVTKSLFSI